MKVLIILSCSLSLVLANCSKDKESEASVDETESAATSLALSEASPSQSLNLVTTALDSFDAAIKEASGSLAIELVEEDKANLSKWCNEHAEPLANADKSFSSLRLLDEVALDDGRLSATSNKFAARLFHCKMKVNTGSPDSIQGLIAMPKGIVCGLEQSKLLDLSKPGKAKGDIKISTPCFTKEFVEQAKSDMGTTTGSMSVELKIMDDGEGTWQKHIIMSDISFDPGSKIEIKLANSEAGMGTLVIETNEKNPGKMTASSFALTKTGELRVETKTYRLGSSDTDNRFNLNLRLLATGSMKVEVKDKEMTAKYSDFDSYQGIYVDIGGANQYVSNINGQLATISGTVEDGFLTKSYVCNREGSHSDADQCIPETEGITGFMQTNSGEAVCVPSTKKCKNLSAIEFKNVDFLNLGNDPAKLEYSPVTWAKSLKKPLDYTSVDSSFAQLPE